MKFTVGGRPLHLTKAGVTQAIDGVEAETIREHLVEIHDTVYPPKQVLATVTDWPRQSFTTMEAKRVLRKLGFVCRRAGRLPDGRAAWLANDDRIPEQYSDERLSGLEAGLVTAQAAIAGLQARVTELESRT